MRRAGGVVALFAGAIGVVTGFVMLGQQGFGASIAAPTAHAIFIHEGGGLLCAHATLVLGAVCMRATSWLSGGLLVMTALCGVFLGSPHVSACMVLALLGGLLVIAEAEAMRR
ncbi:hypothetical protein [Bosea sp. 2RAB26]|uniref:hypothetical protein n=1 Tax=Bosea sp. 2RAB26 TaxID=3237476 RepID=UPI003F927BDD